MSNWNPSTHPFRVLRVYRTNAPGCHGWASVSKTFPTLAEAEVEAGKPFGPADISVRVDEALNPETWNRGGSWRKISKRVRTSPKAHT